MQKLVSYMAHIIYRAAVLIPGSSAQEKHTFGTRGNKERAAEWAQHHWAALPAHPPPGFIVQLTPEPGIPWGMEFVLERILKGPAAGCGSDFIKTAVSMARKWCEVLQPWALQPFICLDFGCCVILREGVPCGKSVTGRVKEFTIRNIFLKQVFGGKNIS